MQSTIYSPGLLPFIQRFQSGGGIQNGTRTQWWNPFSYITRYGQCATWANTLLRDNGYYIWGDAWNLKGPALLYNGYTGVARPTEVNTESLVAYNEKAADNFSKNFNTDTQL